ncbi:pseudouridine synthase [Agrobacterium sp. a22-2]|uniref:pseudouridine synthase n=1 Tax=Agrobacterium sp. a22-2 TaxID=2283840 RepID=UPI001446EB71|nr:pseudouridine synthase [Agrobacterium sp. a22-2]NKN38562.1 pseudouridine synthase [Agrobacterium sp. a22-2]
MTSKDKPTRPAGKPFDRDRKPSPAKSPRTADKSASEAPRKRAEPSTSGEDAMKPERISKLLARVGVASRRDIERMIMEGRVKLNGKVLDTPVVNVTMADKIEVDEVAIRGIERTRLWLYHKPAGLVTTNSDPEGRQTVFDNLPDELPRVMSIGRLDINTEGLLLLTNDGGLARVLELPTTGWLRRYRVRAYGEIDQAGLDKLKDGIAVDGVLYGSIEATLDRTQGHNVWITMGLREGKNREIKNVLGALGLEVNRLIRISYGPFQLGDLPETKVVEVRGRMLRDQLGPRLIEDSKANFDAPIFTNSPDDEEEEATAKPSQRAPERAERPKWSKPEDKRERALGRLDTRRDDTKTRPPRSGERDGDRKGASFGADRPSRPPMGKSRTANVWMAPGARPVSEKTAAKKDETEKRTPRPRPEGAPQTKRYGRSKDGTPTKSFKKFDPDRSSGGAGFARPDPGPRVVVNRAAEDRDWIRADGPDTSKPRGDGEGFGHKKSFGDRPPRDDRPREARSFGDRPRSDRPRDDRPRSDRPRDDRPREDRPRGEKTWGDKPRGDRSADSRPAGGKPYGKPAGARAFGDKPAGAKPFGAKPGGGKSFGGKPGGSKPGGAKPGGARPYSGRPSSDRPGGGKPSGPRGGGKGRG